MRKLVQLILLLFFSSLNLFANSDIFTPQEQAWIKSHPLVSYGVDPAWYPFEYIDEKEEHQGVSYDYLQEVSRISGLKFSLYAKKPWSEVYEDMKNHKIDLLPAVYDSKKRRELFNYSDAYLKITEYVFTRKDRAKITNYTDFKSKRIAVVKGYAVIAWLQEKHPEIELVLYDDLLACIQATASEEVYGYVSDIPSSTYLQEKYFITNIKANILIPDRDPLDLHMAVSKNKPILASIISKSLSFISQAKKVELFYKYSHTDRETLFSISEQRWIQDHPVIRFVGDPNWLPFEAFDKEGNYIGIISEYLQEIEKTTGLKFEKIQTKTWEESVALIKAKKVHMISETTDSKMASFLSFTKPYLQNHIVIVMNTKAKYVDNISLIQDKRLVVIKGYGYVSKIEQAYPKIHFREAKNISEALKIVSSGRADALLCTMALGAYHINKGGFINLRIVGKTEFSTSIGYGVQPDFQPLVHILNKTINSLDKGKKQEILKKWISRKYVEKIDYTLAWQILAASFVLLSLFWYWNRQMKKEISRRIEVEEQLQEANDQVHKSIEFSSMIQRALIPDKKSFENFFSENFTLWKPRDTVGGDIYFFEELRHKDEALLMVVDCTGHGVPGAFVTMLVKAIERNIVGYIKKSDEPVSPAKLLSVLNQSMKHLLKQHDKSAESNAGFDAGILYLNKKENIARYAGAEIALYYSEEDEIQRLKGDRQSVGYRTSKLEYKYKDYEISLKIDMKFYLTTDGYLDQNGGKKGFPFGRNKFQQILQDNQNSSMEKMQVLLLEELALYQGQYEANDDITIVGVVL